MQQTQQNKTLTRRDFLHTVAVGTAALGMARHNKLDADSATPDSLDVLKNSKPNIIFILADDMGYGDLSLLGQTHFKTPNLDRMAAEGMLLTNHYAGSTVCAPSRATLLTGQHTGHVFQRGNGQVEFRPDPLDITLAARLKQAGYHTAMIGKSGLACLSKNAELPNQKGFDHFFGFIDHQSAHRYYPRTLIRNGQPVTYPQNNDYTGVIYSGDLFLDESLVYIEKRSASKQPFFLHLALQQPHADLSSPEEFRQPYLGQFDETPYEKDFYNSQTHPAATYAAMITYVDHTVRRVLEKLRLLGLDKYTMVLFSTDNGSHSEGGYEHRMHRSNASFRGGKRDLYEGGIHVPMIAWWPDTIQAGSRSDHISAFWDFAPTALELAGVPLPPEMDGISYVPTLIGKKNLQKKHEYLYWEFYEQGGKQAVRFGPWKGIRLNTLQNPDGPIELYNLDVDPGEKTDLSDKHPDIVKKIEGYMAKAHTPPELKGFSFKNPSFYVESIKG